jgi:hypothetical protein
MMTSANGTPIQRELAIIDAKPESRFPSERNSRPDMPLLHEPPRVIARCPGMNDLKRWCRDQRVTVLMVQVHARTSAVRLSAHG